MKVFDSNVLSIFILKLKTMTNDAFNVSREKHKKKPSFMSDKRIQSFYRTWETYDYENIPGETPCDAEHMNDRSLLHVSHQQTNTRIRKLSISVYEKIQPVRDRTRSSYSSSQDSNVLSFRELNHFIDKKVSDFATCYETLSVYDTRVKM